MIWGFLHGVYQIPNVLLKQVDKEHKEGSRTPWLLALGALGTCALVTLAWVFFRAPSIGDAFGFLAQGLSVPYTAVDHMRYLPSVGLSGGLLIWEGFTRKREHGLDIGVLPLPVRWAGYVALCLTLLIAGYLGNRAGIYVQF